MKTITKLVALAIIMIVAGTQTTFAQYTSNLRLVELESFNQVEVNADVRVILKKSTRDYITLAGDSSFISSVNISNEEGVLAFDYVRDTEDSLAIVVIEYKDLERVTTGNSGSFYFHELDLDKLEIINPEAKIFLSGAADILRIVSKEGHNDVTAMYASKMVFQIGDAATLIDKSDDTFLSALN